MPSPDLIAPDRLEELLGGALPEAEREARLQGLARELRAAAPAAPAPLSARVRALEEQPARPRRALPRRRTALALAFVLVAIAAVGAGLALRDGPGEPTAAQSIVRASSARGADGDPSEAGADRDSRSVRGAPPDRRRAGAAERRDRERCCVDASPTSANRQPAAPPT